MLKRIITGICYALLICGFFLLRQFVDYRLMHILIFAFSFIGTFELARALKKWLVKGNYILTIIYGGLIVPIYCVLEYLLDGYGLLVLVLPFILSLLMALICYAKQKTLKEIGANVLGYLYPAIFIMAMLFANELGKNIGFIALLLPFVVSALSDTFAFFIGSLIGGKKLCPTLSPKKTWSGAIGGTIGGILGALLVYFIFKSKIGYTSIEPIIAFIIIGVLGSVLTIVGDLFESFIKRKAGIKDMGNILPGHGGVLDRIDGTSFVVLLVYIVFLIIR